MSHYLGAVRQHDIAIEYQEFGDERHRSSVTAALSRIPLVVERVSADLLRLEDRFTAAC